MENKQVSKSFESKVDVRNEAAETAYTQWISKHTELRASDSERRRRLIERDDHSEKQFAIRVWWPVLGSFEHLHPEYEVDDYRDGSRFLDFTYVRPPHRISIEIDGYGPHHKHASRRKFSDDRFRQNQLILDGWIVVRFSYDDLQDRPKQCQQFIQQLLGKLYGIGREDAYDVQLPTKMLELLRWASRRNNETSFRPKDVEQQLRFSRCSTLQYLKALVEHGLLRKASGEQRIRTYQLTPKASRLHL
ncbi:DNA-binding response regulator [Paenibacillus paridis]|uniref:DNA-binding response regulator n=1 Tax=Paenibacillus paridis TaxID=2583376 RepID=UPI00111DB6DB|nr:DNA-binding response regulator [Paenibacillus paridis]